VKNQFDWDQWNSQKSFLKHGITNREAESVFDDARRVIFRDQKHSVEEERYICIGNSEFGRLLYCAFTLREEKLRIISSRPANQKNRDYYEKEKG
jgi:uncharacterized DUF497 family protein